MSFESNEVDSIGRLELRLSLEGKFISVMSSVPKGTARLMGHHTTEEDTGGLLHDKDSKIRMLAGYKKCTGLRSELSIRSSLVHFIVVKSHIT